MSYINQPTTTLSTTSSTDDEKSPDYLKYGLITAGVAAGGFLLYKIFSNKNTLSAQPSSEIETENPFAEEVNAPNKTTVVEKKPTTTVASQQPIPKTTTTTATKATTVVASTTKVTKTTTASTGDWQKFEDELISFKHPASLNPVSAVHPMSGLPMIMLNQSEEYQLFIALQPSQLITGTLVDFVKESFVPLAQMTGMDLGPMEQSNINGYDAVVCKMTQPNSAACLYSVAIMNSVVLAVIQLIQPASAGFADNVDIVDNITKTIVFPEEN